jgi:hypothetical protein
MEQGKEARTYGGEEARETDRGRERSGMRGEGIPPVATKKVHMNLKLKRIRDFLLNRNENDGRRMY